MAVSDNPDLAAASIYIPQSVEMEQERFRLKENNYHLKKEDEGFELLLNETIFNQVRLAWGDYSIRQPQQIEIKRTSEVIDMHFKLGGKSSINGNGINVTMAGNEHSLFYHQNFEGILTLYPTGEKKQSFFDIGIPKQLFDEFMISDSVFMEAFCDAIRSKKSAWAGQSLITTPLMRSIIADLTHTSYTGQMKQLYYEAKLIELFLLQVDMFENKNGSKGAVFNQYDTDRIHDARSYIDLNFDSYCSIKELATTVGINQKKLKQGFKEIFGDTVFGYAQELRMSKAKELLLDKRMPVNRVAEYAGYKNQQHFTVAFKKRYGILPSSLLR